MTKQKQKKEYIRPDIYEATRKFWKIKEDKGKKIDYVLGVYKGIIRSVIKIDRNNPNRIKATDDGRYIFEGELLEQSEYLNKKVPDEYKFTGGAVRYILKK